MHTQLKSSIENKRFTNVLIERLVAWEFVKGYDKASGKIFVNHKDALPKHNYYENLEWVTVSENLMHAYRHGFRKPIIPDNSGPRPSIYGSKNPNAFYSEEIVHKICKMIENGHTIKTIMKYFNTSKKQDTKFYKLVLYISTYKSWRHISSQYNF